MQTVDTTQSVTLEVLAEDWQRSLTAKNMSPKTIKTYMEAVSAPTSLHERPDGQYGRSPDLPGGVGVGPPGMIEELSRA